MAAALRPPMPRLRSLAAALLLGCAAWPAAHAGLFDDDEARKAILDLRKQLESRDEAQRQRQAELNQSMQNELASLRRSLLDLNNLIEQQRGEMARLRGSNEQLARDVAELQRAQKDVQAGVEERIRKLEPVKVTLDEREFLADPEEKRQYDEAFGLIRKSDFAGASVALANFVRRYPGSGYVDAANYWLGNAYYGLRNYNAAIAAFRALLANRPEHPKAPEAMLAIANCQIELKDPKAARKTIGELVQAYPKSEAAQAARERLASLK